MESPGTGFTIIGIVSGYIPFEQYSTCLDISINDLIYKDEVYCILQSSPAFSLRTFEWLTTTISKRYISTILYSLCSIHCTPLFKNKFQTYARHFIDIPRRGFDDYCALLRTTTLLELWYSVERTASIVCTILKSRRVEYSSQPLEVTTGRRNTLSSF